MIASTFMPTLISTVENYVYAIQRSALYILMNIILLARKRSDKRCVRTNSLVRSSRARMNPEGSAFSATSTAFKKKAPAVPHAPRLLAR